MNEYFVYFDQGGLMGKPKLLLSSTKLEEDTYEHALCNYYYGHMTYMAISDLIRLFNHKWPSTPITKIRGTDHRPLDFQNALKGVVVGM